MGNLYGAEKIKRSELKKWAKTYAILYVKNGLQLIIIETFIVE